MLRTLSLAALVIALEGCSQQLAGAAPVSSSPKVEQAPAASAKLVCRDEHVMASNRVQRVCHSKKEWDRIDEARS